ncbi:hypothetical protein DZC30_09795 [Comamonas testosteroni]|uniref:Uncharacterized protein n=1 Tax=Comamonas testosteroni TaxID=285 RepID=A0A373FM58_COMTE|nr:hypothetical protein DZC30_09795 [Comamonas testosteroni]
MGTHSYGPARAASGCRAPASPGAGTKLLTAAQWSLAALGIFCVIAVAVVIAATPEAWPL